VDNTKMKDRMDVISPLGEPVLIDERRIREAAELARTQGHNRVLAVVIATKPCFYKLWGIMVEAKRQQLPFFIIHSSQHYDNTVGYGYKEFGFDEHLGIDLRLRGDLSQKSAELYLKTRLVATRLKELFPDIIVVPYINGDTVTVAHFGGGWMFATNRCCIQGEAGLRAMSPRGFQRLSEHTTPEKLIEMQWDGEWILNRTEPFPEQYDTFVGGASCDYFFSPVAVNTEHLEREGYDPSRICTVGNTVVDAVAAKRAERPERSVFDLYPKLKDGKWLRVDIHRRENLNRRRFHAIIDTVIELVRRGERVTFIELTATRRALEHYGLREKLVELSEKENFLFTPVWQEYAHVIEFLESDNCWAILTDSGSMQEEMNELGKPCMTARFSSDRPETVMAKANILIPPLNTQQMVATVEHIKRDDVILRTMRDAPKLYGKGVSKDIIERISELFRKKDAFFSWSHDRLKIYHEEEFLEYL